MNADRFVICVGAAHAVWKLVGGGIGEIVTTSVTVTGAAGTVTVAGGSVNVAVVVSVMMSVIVVALGIVIGTTSGSVDGVLVREWGKGKCGGARRKDVTEAVASVLRTVEPVDNIADVFGTDEVTTSVTQTVPMEVGPPSAS